MSPEHPTPPEFDLNDLHVRTMDGWRHVRGYAREGSSPWTIAKNYARRHGMAVVMRADDSAVIFVRDAPGSIRQTTLKASEVRWKLPISGHTIKRGRI